jgi:hypothetical protein
MERVGGYIPEEYLDSKIESLDITDKQEGLSAQAELQAPLQEINTESENNLFQGEGQLDFGNQFIRESVGYKPVDFDELDDPWNRKRLRDGKFQELSNLTINSGTDPEKQLDIRNMAPDFKFFFKPSGSISQAEVNMVNKQIEMDGAPNSPDAVLTLLHEIGHIKDMEKRGMNANEYSIGRSIVSGIDAKATPEEMAHILSTERNAWAFALWQIRPFLNDADPQLNKQTVLSSIHNYFLNSYSKSIADNLSSQIIEGA